MDREQLDRWCEWGVLGLILAILVYSPLALGAARPQDFLVVRWLTVGVMALWLPRFFFNPKHRLLWPPLCWAVLAFMGYAVVRYLGADIEHLARQELIRVLVYGFLFFAVINNLHKQETTQFVTLVLIFLAMLLSLYAFFQFVTNADHVWGFLRPETYRKRGSGSFICPNHLAGYLEMLLPLALAYTLTGRFTHVMKVVLAYAALVMFTGIMVTVSRAGWAACALSVVVLFLWLLRQRDYRLQGLLALSALLAIGLVFFLKARLSTNRTDSLRLAEAIENVRFKLWPPALAIWRDHLWVGAGPGHFEEQFPKYRPEDSETQSNPERVHNDYLNTLADWGLIGTLLMAGIWGLFFTDVFRSWRYVQRSQNDLTAKRSNKTAVVMGGSVGLIAILFHSWWDFNMHVPANAILAATLLALISGHFRFATEKYWHTVRLPLKVATTIVLASGLAYLLPQNVQAGRELAALARAQRLQPTKPQSEERLQSLQQAMAIDPKNAKTAYEIGEIYRLRSWVGAEGYEALARTALEWFDRAIRLNPLDAKPWVRRGMCLHWIGQRADAGQAFQNALALDPHGYYTLAHMGWHYVQLSDYPQARSWFEKSLRLNSNDNAIAQKYLAIVREREESNPPPP